MTDTVAEPRSEATLMEVHDLTQEFSVRVRETGRRAVVRAVGGVSFTMFEHETLGIVGETGCGKSTLARSIMQSPRPKSGTVSVRGVELTAIRGRELREVYRHVQMVFQDPFGSIDPKFTVRQAIEEPMIGLKVGSNASRALRVNEIMELVGLSPTRHGDRRAHQLSGGQCQRVAIARALSISPDVLICDESVSSLDVLIQAQILNLFGRLREELGISYLFISHDLAVVKQISDRVAVMHLGKFCEVAPTDLLFSQPLHPYTATLLAANPSIDPRRRNAHVEEVIGEPPSPIDPPSGCSFRTRCPYAQERCSLEEPPLRELAPGHSVACHFPLLPGVPRVPSGPNAIASVA
jgi:oligopeptide/dipeptide ABC transporter ATP-binding protein